MLGGYSVMVSMTEGELTRVLAETTVATFLEAEKNSLRSRRRKQFLLAQTHSDLPIILLQEAVALAPEDARFAYVYVIALNSTGRSRDALEIQKQADARHPTDADILTALVTISRDQVDGEGAIAYAEQLVRVARNNAQAKMLLEALREL